MQLGQLNRPITIEEPVYTADLNGQEVETWSSLGTFWASLSYQSGVEKAEAEQRVARRVVRFTIRYNANVTELCRIYYDQKYFYIIGIDRVHRKKYQIIKAYYADRGFDPPN